MDPALPTDVVLGRCRFVSSRAELGRLLPGLEFEVPVPQELGELGAGWAVRPPNALRTALLQHVAEHVRSALREDGEPQSDSYYRELEAALFDAVAQAPGARLDTLVWLWLLDEIPRILRSDPALFAWFDRHHPDHLAAHRTCLDDLGRLASRNPGKYASVRRKVVTAIDAGHELLATDLEQRAGEAAVHLLAHVGVTPVLHLVEEGRFHSDLSLHPIFLGREGFVDDETFERTRRLIQAIVDTIWRRRAVNRANPGERWALGYFASDGMVGRAAQLDPAVLPGGEGDEAVRVAVLASLQPDLAEYLLHHTDRFAIDEETSARYRVREDQLALLADPESLALRAAGYRDVVEEILRWDVLNALRGMVHVADVEGDRYLCGEQVVSADAFVLDLNAPPPPPMAASEPSGDALAPLAEVSLFEGLDSMGYDGEWDAPPGAGDEPASDYGFDTLFGSVPDQEAPPPPAGVDLHLSLLGALDDDFVELLQGYELGPSTVPPMRRPDVGELFAGYVIFPVGRLGAPGSAIAIARPEEGGVSDLHLFPVPRNPDWRPEQALDEFMRAKVESRFAPGPPGVSAFPPRSGDPEPLSPRRLQRAYERVVGSIE